MVKSRGGSRIWIPWWLKPKSHCIIYLASKIAISFFILEAVLFSCMVSIDSFIDATINTNSFGLTTHLLLQKLKFYRLIFTWNLKPIMFIWNLPSICIHHPDLPYPQLFELDNNFPVLSKVGLINYKWNLKMIKIW